MELLDEIYRSKTVHDAAGNAYPLRAEVSAPEGRFIAEMIGGRPDISKSVEVGCAYGLSSLHICSAMAGRPNPRHIVIDPFQNTKWHGVGLAKKTFLPKFAGEAQMHVMRSLRQVLDPNGILNPGKMFDAFTPPIR